MVSKLKKEQVNRRVTDKEGSYEEGKIDSDYCQLYCTQRAKVSIPGPITATNGMNFKLTTKSTEVFDGSISTSGPVIQGFKRCRIRIDYAKWITEYMEQVNQEIENYNDYQKNQKYYELYDSVLSNSKPANHVTTGDSKKEYTNKQYKIELF